jgi:hypothetical protein
MQKASFVPRVQKYARAGMDVNVEEPSERAKKLFRFSHAAYQNVIFHPTLGACEPDDLIW